MAERPELPDLPRERDGPVFAEPWQAQAFAMVVALHEAGLVDWRDWSAVLGEALRDTGSHLPQASETAYYEAWLTALERLVEQQGLVGTAERLERIEAWAEAVARTPHGRPITLDLREPLPGEEGFNCRARLA